MNYLLSVICAIIAAVCVSLAGEGHLYFRLGLALYFSLMSISFAIEDIKGR